MKLHMNKTGAMKGTLVLVALTFILLSIAVVSGASGFEKSDYLTKVETRTGITEAYTWYRVCNPEPEDYLIDSPVKFSVNFIEAENKLTSYEFKKLETITENVTEYESVCTESEEGTYENGSSIIKETCERKESGWHLETREEWMPFEPDGFTFEAGKCYDIRVEGTYPAKLGKTAIDNQITAFGHTFSEYDWWNASWSKRKKITVTCQNASGCSLEPMSVYTYNDSEINSSASYPADIRMTSNESGAEVEIPYMFTNISGNNTEGVLFFANSTTSGTDYYIYYDGPSEGANYSCNLGSWSPCWVNDTSESLFLYRENFEKGLFNQSGKWISQGDLIYGINTSNPQEGNYAMYLKVIGSSGWHGLSRLFSEQTNRRIYTSYWMWGNDMIHSIRDNSDSFPEDYYLRHDADGNGAETYDGTWNILKPDISIDKHLNWQTEISLGNKKLNTTFDTNKNTSLDPVNGGESANRLSLFGPVGDTYAIVDNIYISTNEFHTYNNTSTYLINSEETNESTGLDYATEAEGRISIEKAMNSSLDNPPIYEDQQIVVRNNTNHQNIGTLDKFTLSGNQRWAVNYITTGENYTNMFNITPVFYVLELTNKTESEIETEVGEFINSTKL